MKIRSILRGCGAFLPKKIVTNLELSERVDASDTWIRERTGIEQRHIAGENETTSDLGYKAALSALDDAGISAQDIDLIIVATTTPDYTFPSTATIIQELSLIHI